MNKKYIMIQQFVITVYILFAMIGKMKFWILYVSFRIQWTGL